MADVWNADHGTDPYRVYQQMDENGWTAADLAQTSGMTEQQAGDWLTRLGAQAGFGGSVTVGRDAIDNPFTTAMTAAQQSGTGPGWVAAAPESRAKDDPDDGGTPSTAFDVGAFTQWYVSQDTPEAQAFARIQGAFTVDSGVVRFASGATASMQCPDPVTRDTPSPSVPVFSWQADQRVADYQTFAKGDAFSLASIAQDIETPANDQLIQVFGDPNAPLPENEMGERMRAMYGTSLATYMVRLQTATDAMRSKYVGALNQALARRPTSPDASSPFWTAHSSPGAVHWDGNQGRQVTDPPVVTYTFDTDAFSQWYAQQGEQAQLIQQTFGAGLVATAGGFGTTGSTTPLSFSVNTTAYDETSPSGNDAWYLSNAGPDVPSVSDSTLGLKLQEFTLGDPPPMHDDRLVSFLPGYGFVTPEANVKQDDLLEQIVDLAAVAVVTYFSAGTLGPEVAGGLGFAQGSLGAAMVTAAVTGMASTTVSEAISGDLQLKDILKAGLAGALSGGMLNELQGVTGSLGLLGKVGAQALTQGSVQALMGGSFEQGAIAGGISGFASAVSDNINGSITQQVNAGLMTPAQAVAARYTGSMLSAAIKIAGSGPNTSGYAEACAFINDTCVDIATTSDPMTPVAAVTTATPVSESRPSDPVTPTPTSTPASTPTIVPAPAASSTTPPLPAPDLVALFGQTSWLTPPSDSLFSAYVSPDGSSSTPDGDTSSDDDRQAALHAEQAKADAAKAAASGTATAPDESEADFPPLDDTPLPRTLDGGVMLPDGRIVHPSVTVTVHDVDDAPPPASTDAAAPAAPATLGTFTRRLDSRIPAVGPVGLTRPDGSPVTYSFDSETGQAYWDDGTPGVVRAIPKAFQTPTFDEAVLDPSNPWTQGPRMNDVLAGFGLSTATGVAGLATGGLTFGALRAGGYGVLASGAGAGFVGDLTTQIADNGVSLATQGSFGRTGIDGTELALSTGVGALPGLPGAASDLADELRGMGASGWKIGLASPTPGTTYGGLPPLFEIQPPVETGNDPGSQGFDTSNLQSKLQGYLLDATHPQNQTKAVWFDQALGFTSDNWQDLASQLKFDEATATQTKVSQYGTTYEQVIPINGANGNIVNTTFVFMKDNNGVVRLVTGIPTKR